MKLTWFCQTCFFGKHSETGSISIPEKEVYAQVELRNDGRYDVTCENGHKSIVLLQEDNFEILFDMGCMAILDGYHREAVSSLAASAERLYEFFIRVILAHHNIAELEFNKTWKFVENQSERQLGAFCFLYLMEFNTSPVEKKLADQWAGFRNKVIHKGYIPSVNEVMDYGEYLLPHINHIIKLLKGKYGSSITRVVTQRMAKLSKDNNGVMLTTMSIPTIVSLTAGGKDYGTKSFREELEQLGLRVHKSFITK